MFSNKSIVVAGAAAIAAVGGFLYFMNAEQVNLIKYCLVVK